MENPVIFLVEDFEDNTPIPLITKKFPNLRDGRGYLEEIPRMLSSQPPTHILFVKVKDFIKYANTSTFPYHRKIYYFISAYHVLATFTIFNLSLIDKEVIDFLVKYRISIIIDASIEESQIKDNAHYIFDHSMDLLSGKILSWRGILDLPIYLINGGYKKTYRQLSHLPNIHHKHFHGSFFHCTYPGTKNYNQALENREQLFKQIDSKIVTDNTLLWQAFCREPRLSRILFQLNANHSNLRNIGEYSRLIPCGDFYKRQHRDLNLSSIGIELDPDDIIELDKIQTISNEPTINEENIKKNLGLFHSNSLIHIVLETCSLHSLTDIQHQPTQLTEKTSTAILSGMPFIPLGGQFVNPLELLGFHSYFMLDWPNNENFLDSLSYVSDLLLKLSKLSTSQKNELYNTWKETIKYNFDNFFKINIQEMYLTFLKLENSFIRMPE